MLLGLCTLSACASPDVHPLERQIEQLRGQTRRAVRSAEEAVAAEAPFRLRARYNPPHCDCPSFEVFYASSWHRVVMQASPELLRELETRREANRPFWLLGSPTGQAEGEEGAQLFERFELAELPPPEPVPVPELPLASSPEPQGAAATPAPLHDAEPTADDPTPAAPEAVGSPNSSSLQGEGQPEIP